MPRLLIVSGAGDILNWCSQEAKRSGLKGANYWGGLVIDEMKIQLISGQVKIPIECLFISPRNWIMCRPIRLGIFSHTKNSIQIGII